MKQFFFAPLLAGPAFIGLLSAQTSLENPDTLLVYNMPTVQILGEKPGLLGSLPGSATFISALKIRAIQPVSGNEVFRTVPGVHVLEEEGIGLRANIGIRGLDPDRSGKILVLEDGIPIALNPFGEPQLYYTPTIDRMKSVEVLKGSGQILFGPQTIGGVVNYITADPPANPAGFIRLNGGEGGYFSLLAGYGATYGNAGFQVNYLRKQADAIGPTHFRLDDISGKLKWQTGKYSSLGMKIGVYRERSNATYVGITQTMYDQGGQDFAVLAPEDWLDVQRISASLAHERKWGRQSSLKTTAFAYTTDRNWQRQEFSYNAAAANQTGVIWGDPSVAGGAIYMRDRNGHRDRQFQVAGIESRLETRFDLGKLDNQLEAGIRYIFERAFEQRVNGTTAGARSGDLINDEIRTGNSFSAWAQEKLFIAEKWTFSFGIRSEVYDYSRHILRENRVDTSILADNRIAKVIPGAGINYRAGDGLTLFTGIHRGFAPPRVADAIASNGTVYNLDPELSWNAEAGLRLHAGEWGKMELTGFNMSFSNQVIPISESSGGAGSGLANGGSTLHRGLESAFEIDFGQFWLGGEKQLVLSGQFTYIDARFNRDRLLGAEKVNIKGNRTPYAPEYFAAAAVQYGALKGFQFRLNGQYTGGQFSDELNTQTPAANGQTGWIPAYFVMDGTVQYAFEKPGLLLSLSVKNLTDERYIVSRRPQGIRVGLPRMVFLGVEYRF